MSEKIYAWLLRLYPSHFRDAYGDAVLQLFRDRSRHERGVFPSLCLWLDLLVDLAITVPRQYCHVQPARPVGTPSFYVLEGESPRLGALLLGGVLSLGAVGASIQIGHLANYRLFLAGSAAHPAAYTRWPASSRRTTLAAGDTGDFQESPRVMAQAVAEGAKLSGAERERVVHSVIANLKEHYVDPAAAQKIADALLAHEKSGDYDALTDGAAFADLLTRHLREASHDLHLDVLYSQARLPDRPPLTTTEGLARYRKAMEQAHCTFEPVKILPHNAGYLKLNSFPDPSVCQATATAAMSSLNQADVVIFDLRDNRGGYPDMVMLIAAYLFDHPEYMYNPRENTTERSWTRSPVPGSRLADKPVYVLTSATTSSGAEHFSYDLKMLKRATLVGETTGGAAHAGVFHRIDDHFGMGIPETRAINPFSKADWAVTGVEPDVKVKAADALERAEQLVESRLRAAGRR
jgi:Peptidase family S41/N-terminal domain of Peptidase_S41 in eukaryotic IRBP